MLSKLRDILKVKYPQDLSEKIIELYSKILSEYRKKNWQNCISNVGQFNEAIYRVLEFELMGVYIDLSTQVPQFQNSTLSRWENVPNKPEIYRIVIPRVLYSMYCLRNKRGAVHLSNISPNEIDANLLVQQVKWILAEIVRMASNLSFDETANLIKQITCKEVNAIWDTGENIRVLENKLTTTQKVLCLLYYKDGQKDRELFINTGYKNFNLFKNRILKEMHKNRFIEYDSKCCKISPLGVREAEEIYDVINL